MNKDFINGQNICHSSKQVHNWLYNIIIRIIYSCLWLLTSSSPPALPHSVHQRISFRLATVLCLAREPWRMAVTVAVIWPYSNNGCHATPELLLGHHQMLEFEEANYKLVILFGKPCWWACAEFRKRAWAVALLLGSSHYCGHVMATITVQC